MAAKKSSKSASKKSAKRGDRRAAPDLSVLGEHPTPDLFPVMSYFRQHTDAVPEAMDVYFSTIEATPEGQPDQASEDALLGTFMEWFIFDYQLPGGQTPLSHYALVAPSRTPEQRATAELLRQAAATQFFSLFWLRAADKAAGTLTLQDAASGVTYEVFDEDEAAKLAGREGALVATRLMRQGEEWRIPLGSVLSRDGLDEERFSRTASELAEMGGGIGFIDAVRLELGSVDPAVPAAKAPTGEAGGTGAAGVSGAGDADANAADAGVAGASRPAAGVPQVALDGPADQVPGVTVPPEHRGAALMDAAKYYGLLRRDLDLRPTWEDIAEAVRTCPAGRDAHDVVTDLFGADAQDLNHLTDDEFAELMDAFLMAWNLLPHDSLGGRSVAEVYQGR